MGIAMEVVAGSVTNPSTTITACTPVAPSSFTVRSFDAGASADLIELWTGNATGGTLRIRSPRLHDPAQGIRFQVPAGNQYEYMPRQIKQALYSVDLLTVEMSGGASEVDTLGMLVYYSNLGGVNANLVTWAQIQDQVQYIMGLELDLVSGATAGAWGGARTFNQDFQNLKADATYAVLGYNCASAFGSLGIYGPDTGNLIVGGPGSTNTDVTGDWFIRLSQWQSLPTIPVIKANNQGGTYVQLLSSDTATSHHVSLLLAQIS